MNNNLHTFVVLAYKESNYLEECIKSVLNQSIKSNVVIATSTKNDYITNVAKKYKLKLIVNKEQKGIGYDFDFALNCVNSKLVTIAHQDDIYEEDYLKNILEYYNKYNDSIILFTDYFEIRKKKKVFNNRNLKIKKLLLKPLKLHKLTKFKFIKRLSIRFGCAICCPSVTFNKELCPKKVFSSKYKSNVDWFAWEKLSLLKGRFIYISKSLMGHRIHEDSETSNVLNNNIRINEDREMFNKFWPKFITNILIKFYKKAEESNN